MNNFVYEVINAGGSVTKIELEPKENSIFLTASIFKNFNSSLFLNLRCFNRVDNINFNHFAILNSDFEIEEKFIIDTSKFDVLPLCEYCGLEDARLVEWDNKMYLCGNNRYDFPISGRRRIYLSEVQIENGVMSEISRYCVPSPEANDSDLEKNWMPILDMPYHFVRWSDPTEIVKYDIEKNTTTIVHKKEKNTKLENLRGSSQVISWEDGYLAVVHENYYNQNTKWIDKTGHRFLFWDKDWNLIKVSNEFFFFNHGIEFCAGLIYQDNQFLLSISINEHENFIIKCPSSVVEEMMGFNFKITNTIINMNYIDTTPNSDWGIIKTDKFKLSEGKDKRLFVVDNFYEDPLAVRDFALSQFYFDDAGYLGMRTRKRFLFDGVKERIEQIIGEKITDWDDQPMNGRFQTCKAGIPLVYHCDSQKWAAMVYLTPDAPIECGTSFYRHKQSKKYHNSQICSDDDLITVFNQKTFSDKTPYEMVDTVGNVFNRLVIFDGGLIHAASDYFGWDIASSRLFHMYFFS